MKRQAGKRGSSVPEGRTLLAGNQRIACTVFKKIYIKNIYLEASARALLEVKIISAKSRECSCSNVQKEFQMRNVFSLRVGVFFFAMVVVSSAGLNCGGLSPTCQKAKACCTAVQASLGQSGSEVKISCEDSNMTASCEVEKSSATLGDTVCTVALGFLNKGLESCKRDVPAECK